MTTTQRATTQWPRHSNGRLTIDLGALVSNWKYLNRISSGGPCAAVVKADGYGLGAREVTSVLYKNGCREFFTATISEGAELRKVAPQANIYIFNGFNPAALGEYKTKKLTPIINSPRGISAWLEMATNSMRCGLHLDTGINRLGLTSDEFKKLHSQPEMLTQLNPQLVMSHLACADEPAHPMNSQQIKRFAKCAAQFPNARKSLANSAGLISLKNSHFDLPRPGIALYGGEAVNGLANPMKPVVRLEGRIIQIKHAKRGEFVGYGAAEKLKRDTKIAIVGIGYADGLHRQASGAGTLYRRKRLSPGGHGMIGKTKVPILGRISMDIACFDVSDVPDRVLAKNQWVDLINKEIHVDDLARAAGTIGYEIFTSLGRRYERIYTGIN